VDYDAIILGWTIAAKEAAHEASRRGLRALVLPRAVPGGSPGGHSRWYGSALHRMREGIARIAKHRAGGSEGDGRPGSPDLDASAEAEDADAQWLEALRAAGVDVDETPGARFESSCSIRTASGSLYRSPLIVVATGDRPRRPARFEFDDRVVCDSRSGMPNGSIPRSVLVIGAESAGCEIACLFAALGSSVTVIDRRQRCLRFVDRDVIELLYARMQQLGIDLILSEWLSDVSVRSEGTAPHARVTLESGRVEVCERVIVAAGTVPHCAGLGLSTAGVHTDDLGFIIADDEGRTSQPGVHAAGSVVSGLMEQGEAHQGRRVVRAALGIDDPVTQPVPLLIRTIPEIAMVGMTSEACLRLDVPFVAAAVPLEDEASSDPDVGRRGLLKLVVDGVRGGLLGVHAIGPLAAEIIHLGAWIMRTGGTVHELANTVFCTPSLSEAYRAAAIQCLMEMAEPTEGASTAEESRRW